MVSKRIIISKILAQAVLCLLSCGIVAGELPELLSLTDNATNDFTVRGARSVVPTVRLKASKHVRIVDKAAPAPNLLLSRLGPSDIFIFCSILRI